MVKNVSLLHHLLCQLTGTTLSLVLDIDSMIAIIGSACIAVVYTFLGGLYSVAYTDIIQLLCVAIGLVR